MPETIEMRSVFTCDDYDILADNNRSNKVTVLEIHWHPEGREERNIRLAGMALGVFLNTLKDCGNGDSLTRAIFEDPEFLGKVTTTPGCSVV